MKINLNLKSIVKESSQLDLLCAVVFNKIIKLNNSGDESIFRLFVLDTHKEERKIANKAVLV
jgi:hypothetical protein